MCRFFLENTRKATSEVSEISNATGRSKNAQAMEFPERLLIYHAGARTVYLASLKMCTMFLAVFAVGLAAPGVYTQLLYPPIPDHDSLEGSNQPPTESLAQVVEFITLPVYLGGFKIPAQLAATAAATITAFAGLLPFLLMQYVSPPYVTHAHLHLPVYARYSLKHLQKYIETLPPSAKISFVTIRYLGRPQNHNLEIGQLRRQIGRMGCSNLTWKGIDERGKVIQRDFFVDEKGSPGRLSQETAGLMGNILTHVRYKSGLQK